MTFAQLPFGGQLLAEAAFDDDDRDECSWCGGDGTQDCDDPLGCTKRHYGGSAWRHGWEDCSACGGSGLAKDQTIW